MIREAETRDSGLVFEPSFGPRGELRQKLGSDGRLHLDRWLPFLVLNRSAEPATSIARRVAVYSPAHLVWSPDDDEEAERALEAVLGALRQQIGPVLLIEVSDMAWEPRKEDSPELPAFDVEVAFSGGKAAQAAFEALADAVGKIEVELRRPAVKSSKSGCSEIAGGGDCLKVRIPPIHRDPDGRLFPQLTQELAVTLLDSLLRAAAAYMAASGTSPPPHYRSLGRSAFLAAALNADKKLDAVARSFDFLLSLSPINTDEAMRRFVEQGEDRPPEFRYRPLAVDPDIAKRALYEIDLGLLEEPLLQSLLCEKRRELDYQLTLLATRNTHGFRPASILLYGAVGPQLLSDAHAVLASVKPAPSPGETIEAAGVATAARELIERYRSADPRFEAKVEIRDDVSGLLVSAGRLLVSSSSAIAAGRLDALLSHEVSVHLLTYFNGAAQGLTIFRTGLAHYEGIQEGLGVFAEWAVGGLTPARLRLLAGRVVAVEAMIDGATFIDVYRRLNRDLGFTKRRAFDITARVFRSGGFAKDAIYLKGFRDVVDRVATGASLEAFWLGKIAPEHVDAVEELLLRGLLHGPVFVPEFLGRKEAQERIARLRGGLPFDKLLELE